MIRSSRFGIPGNYYQLQAEEQKARYEASQRIEIIYPTSGLHAGLSPESMPEGYTPASENFVSESGRLRPRNGYDEEGGHTGLSMPRSAFRVFDVDGLQHAIAASTTSVSFVGNLQPTWSELSYITGFGSDYAPSGNSRTPPLSAPYSGSWEGFGRAERKVR